MTRDNQDRSSMFSGNCGSVIDVEVNRIALNYDQVEEYSPPPNPAKFTDARAEKYVSEFGDSCWELDALEPSVIADLITENVMLYRDDDIYNEMINAEASHKKQLQSCAGNWERIVKFMKKKGM